MNVLVAVVDDQPGGFSWGIEGELVFPDPYGDRAWIGATSHKGTSLAEVGTLDITRRALVDVLTEQFAEMATQTGIALDVRRWVGMTLGLAAHPVGTLLRRGNSNEAKT